MPVQDTEALNDGRNRCLDRQIARIGSLLGEKTDSLVDYIETHTLDYMVSNWLQANDIPLTNEQINDLVEWLRLAADGPHDMIRSVAKMSALAGLVTGTGDPKVIFRDDYVNVEFPIVGTPTVDLDSYRGQVDIREFTKGDCEGYADEYGYDYYNMRVTIQEGFAFTDFKYRMREES